MFNMKVTLFLIVVLRSIFCTIVLSSKDMCYKKEFLSQPFCPVQRKNKDFFIIILGGFSESNTRISRHTPTVEAVQTSPKTDGRCSFLPLLPESVDGAVSFFHDVNHIYICGGFGRDFSGNCWKSNGRRWKNLGVKISPRKFSTSQTTHHQFTYILGGETRKNVLNSLEVLIGPNLQSSLRKPLKYGISRHCLVQVDDDNLVAIGGRLVSSGKQTDFSDKVFSYSISRNDWSDFPNIRQGRQLHSCATVDVDFQPKIVVVGGRNNEILKTVEIFDYEKKVWSQGRDLKVPIYMSALVPNNLGGVILIGGQSKHASSDRIYKLESVSYESKWTEDSKKLLEPRRSHSALISPSKFCQDHWKILVVGPIEHGVKETNASFVLDLSSEEKVCKDLPKYPIFPKQPAHIMDTNDIPFFCGYTTSCYKLVKGAWQEGPSLNEARERAFMIQIHTTSRSFLWIGGSFGSVSTETLDDQDTVWKTSVSFPDSWKTFGICAVEINQDNILVSPTNMAESKVLIVSEMKLVEGPAPSLSGKENSVCGRIRTKPYSLERSLVRIVAQTKFIEFLDVGLGNWDPKMSWRSTALQFSIVCHSQLVETPDGGIVLVAGGIDVYTDKIYKLDHSGETNWKLLKQKLPFIITHHAALIVPDRTVDCN